MKKSGCEIEHLATSPVLQRRLNAYIRYKRIEEHGSEEWKIKLLQAADLYDNIELFLRAEDIFRAFEKIELARSKKNGR